MLILKRAMWHLSCSLRLTSLRYSGMLMDQQGCSATLSTVRSMLPAAQLGLQHRQDHPEWAGAEGSMAL